MASFYSASTNPLFSIDFAIRNKRGANKVTAKKKPQLRTTVRLPDDVHHASKVAAATRSEPIQEFIAEAIRIRLRSLGMGDMLKPQARRLG